MARRTGACLARAAVAAVLLGGALVAAPRAHADTTDVVQPAAQLKHLSLEQLLQIEVTSVSRSPEPLSQTASAIQVVTSEEIRRSAAQTLPEALRLANNFEVAQVNAHDWAITARGFDGTPLASNSLADKLLVLIDGRTVYTPLFAGVFWDVQHTLLEDVDRIEAISGPGGTLWGANAVNGVINVVTKSARETQGWYVSGSGGTPIQDLGAARYGGRLGDRTFYRVYGQRLDERATQMPDGGSANDAWWLTQGGFRVDHDLTRGSLTLQGDAYGGREGEPDHTRMNGQNVLGRWTRPTGSAGEFSLQVFFDRTWRRLQTTSFQDQLQTWDLDAQHRMPLGARHTLVWGVGARLMEDRVHNTPALMFVPARRQMNLGSAFVQDQVALRPDRVTLTLGTKFEHNAFSGDEWQPGARLDWAISERNAVWAAFSRAVRSPSRFDADLVTPVLSGDPAFASEKLDAWECGVRVRPVSRISASVAVFANRYHELRSVDFNTVPLPPFVFANDQRAHTEGLEITTTVQALPGWRLVAGAWWLDHTIEPTSPEVVHGSDTFEFVDPHDHLQLHSMMDLRSDLQLDIVARAVGPLGVSSPTPGVPGYGAADVRLAWHEGPVELAVLGTNLWNARHVEFVRDIPRGVSGRVTWRVE